MKVYLDRDALYVQRRTEPLLKITDTGSPVAQHVLPQRATELVPLDSAIDTVLSALDHTQLSPSARIALETELLQRLK